MQNNIPNCRQKLNLNADCSVEDATIVKIDFIRWNNVKINLELHGRQPNPSQGEIW